MGRYYCRECYNRLKEKPRRPASAAPNQTADVVRTSANQPAREPNIVDDLVDYSAAHVAVPQRICRSCGRAIEDDGRICTYCGFDRISASRAPAVMSASRPSGLGRGPVILAASIAMAALVSIAPIAITGDEAAFGLAGLFVIGWFITYLVWLLRHAYRVGGFVQQALCFFVPFYFLYFVFFRSPSRYLKGATVAYVFMWGTLVVAVAVMPAPQPRPDVAGFAPQVGRTDLTQQDAVRPAPSQNRLFGDSPVTAGTSFIILGVHALSAHDGAVGPCYLIEIEMVAGFILDWSTITQEVPGAAREQWPIAYEPTSVGRNRWVFFFHDLDLKRPLNTPIGPMALPATSPRPPHLLGVKYVRP
jgi:hypothetical protein